MTNLATIRPMPATLNPSAPFRIRFRQLLHDAEVSQNALCKRLSKRTGALWRPSRMSKILNGTIIWTVDDLVLMAEESGVSLIDLFRHPGKEFFADLTPTELKMIHAVRDIPLLRSSIEGMVAVAEVGRRQRKVPQRIIRERMRLNR